jgi:uracil-DNA glycosylase
MDDIRLEPEWKAALAAEFELPYFKQLRERVRFAYQTGIVYPPPPVLFQAFTNTPLSQVRVVILGQDPYHSSGQAHGLAFSVSKATQPLPPSLQNIFKEIERDLGKPRADNGDLTRWTTQEGVLLLNSVLTVKAGTPGSHRDFGWETFTDAAIKVVNDSRSHVVFLLWGAFAIRKRTLIDETKHFVLTAPHPSPLSAHRGFIGCGHFSAVNDYFNANGLSPINW